MLLYIIASVTIGFFLYFYNYNSNHIENNSKNIKYLVKYIPNDKLYFYCNVLAKKYKARMISNNIIKLKSDLDDRWKWLDNINKVNNELYQSSFQKKYTNVLKMINEKNHYCYWVLDNDLSKLLIYKLIALDLKTVYNYDNSEYLQKEYLINLSSFCHKHKIIFVIISELHPSQSDICNENCISYFNINNYISPYHYKVKIFGAIERLPEKKLSNKPASVSINKIILDIMNRYGIDNDNLIYLGAEKINNINCEVLTLL